MRNTAVKFHVSCCGLRIPLTCPVTLQCTAGDPHTHRGIAHLSRRCRRRQPWRTQCQRRGRRSRRRRCGHFFFFSSHFYFPAPGQAVVTGVVPSPPRFLPSIFIAHRVQRSHCSSIFHRVFANSLSRAFHRSICAQEKVPTNVYEYALGGARTHETDLYQARG